MFDKIAVRISPIVDGALSFYSFMQAHQLILALLSGLTLPFLIVLKRDEHEKAAVWQKLVIGFSMLCFLFGTLAPVPTWFLQHLYRGRNEVNIPVLKWSFLLIATIVGFIFHIAMRRIFSPELDRLKRKIVKKSSLEREVRTDVRHIKSLLPTTEHYDPMDYIDLSKGIFIGLDREKHRNISQSKTGKNSTPTLSAPRVPVKVWRQAFCFTRVF